MISFVFFSQVSNAQQLCDPSLSSEFENKCRKSSPGFKITNSSDFFSCFCTAIHFSQKNENESLKVATKIMSDLCKNKKNLDKRACDGEKAYRETLEMNENQAIYDNALKDWETSDLKTLDVKLKIISKLCAKKFSNSCENKNILKNNLQEMNNQSNSNDSEAEIAKQINSCKSGNKNMCWDLYIGNKDNEHGYGFLRDACIFGHKQACNAKQVIDQENHLKYLNEQQERVAVQQQRENEINQQNYEREQYNKRLDEYRRREIEINQNLINSRKRRSISCSSSLQGSYLNTNCNEY